MDIGVGHHADEPIADSQALLGQPYDVPLLERGQYLEATVVTYDLARLGHERQEKQHRIQLIGVGPARLLQIVAHVFAHEREYERDGLHVLALELEVLVRADQRDEIVVGRLLASRLFVRRLRFACAF